VLYYIYNKKRNKKRKDNFKMENNNIVVKFTDGTQANFKTIEEIVKYEEDNQVNSYYVNRKDLDI
jgi:hypothetical protein